MKAHSLLIMFLSAIVLPSAIGTTVFFDPLDETTWFYPLKFNQPDMECKVKGGRRTKRTFHIIPHTNILSNKTSLDQSPFKPTYQVSVDCSPYGQEEVTVAMLTNMYSPTFMSPVYRTSILDSMPVCTPILQVSAFDQDLYAPANIVTYTINPPSRYFNIDADSGNITISSSLTEDQNLAQEYTLGVVATDGGTEPLSTNTDVTIYVVRNKPPEFNKTSYSGMVSDRAPVLDHAIQTVSATDDMVGATREHLTYSIVTEDARRVFVIDEKTGAIAPRVELTYPDKKIWNFRVAVHDSGSPPLSDETNVSITIVSPPAFEQSAYSVDVKADVDPGKTIMPLAAKEPSGLPMVYALTGDDEAVVYFSIGATTGNITVRTSLTKDKTKPLAYTLKCQAHPENFDGQVAETTVTVEVLRRSLPPKFTQSEYMLQVNEDAAGYLFTLKANDDDGDGVTFSLQSDSFQPPYAEELFTVDPDTGAVSVTALFAHDFYHVYTFNAVAEDKGNPRPSSSALVTVAVKRNLNSPTFHNNPYAGTVPETHPVGESVLRVSTTDPDGDDVTYSIEECSRDNEFFKIDPKNGTIFLARSLLSELRSDFTIEVTAKDSAHIPRSRTADVWIGVTRNMNVPIFQQQAAITLSEDTAVNTIVDHVEAEDKDPPETPGGQLVYSLSDSTPEDCSDLFSVLSTGHIVLQNTLSGVRSVRCLVTVQASDVSPKPRSASTTVTINIARNN